jgi:hypothetical protein
MEEAERNYHAFSQSKLEYASTKDGDFNRLYGMRVIPDIGSEPEDIETTTLDNEKFKTSILGLQDVQKYTFEFNMEDPSAESNYKIACDLEDSKNVYYWKLTLSNGVVISFRSKVTTSIQGGEYGDLIGFTMTLAPIGEPEKTIPTTEA